MEAQPPNFIIAQSDWDPIEAAVGDVEPGFDPTYTGEAPIAGGDRDALEASEPAQGTGNAVAVHVSLAACVAALIGYAYMRKRR